MEQENERMGFNIILVSHRGATRSITLTQGRLLLIITLLIGTMIGLSSLLSYWMVRHAAEARLPFLKEFLQELTLEEESRTRRFVQENLGAMAVRLGQMQAQLMQLDNLGEHLAALAGVKPKEHGVAVKGLLRVEGEGGGPLIRPENLTADEVDKAVEMLSREVERRSQLLSTIEERLLETRIRAQLVPTAAPVEKDARMSGFGWRIDPFTGQNALHEGIDFLAEPGSPILAAAAGVVVAAERHPDYGLYVELDHGDGLTTRYAHAQSLLVKPGDIVRRGQQIATVGMTGRATGPHLHFEVRKDGVAQNPARYLGKSGIELARR